MPKQLAKPDGYKELVKKIQSELSQLDFFIKRRTAQAYWRVGKFIYEHLLQYKDRADYNEGFYEDLSKDVDSDPGTLSKTVRFYRIYPILDARPKLTWTHYRALITVEDKNERTKLEKQIAEKDWNTRKLQKYLKSKRAIKAQQSDEKEIPQLKFTRGELFTYSVVENPNSQDELLLDMGFRDRREFKQTHLKVSKGDCVKLDLKDESFTKVSAAREEIFTYKAKVLRVKDGDTLFVFIELGLGNFREETLRLRAIDCPEIDTPEGQKAKRFVESRLNKCNFIVVKTFKDSTDKYDRYLTDVFYLINESDPEKIAQEGIFLNQELLDNGLATLWQ